MTMTHSRDRLQEVQARTSDARGKRAAAQKVIDAAIRVGDMDAEAAGRQALEVAHTELETARELERILLGQIAGVSIDAYTFGDNWLDQPETLRELQALAHGTRPIGNVNVGPLMSADQFANVINTGAWHTPKWGAPVPRSTGGGDVGVTPFTANSTPSMPAEARYEYLGVVSQLKRRIRLLDLIPAITMDTGNFFWLANESGSLDMAAETAELSLKPSGDLSLTSKMVQAATIASWLKAPRQALADVAGFGQTIQQRLTYSVLRRVENQIVSGDGTASNLTGVLHTAGIQNVPFTAGAILADQVLNGITLVTQAEAEPDAVIINPADEQKMLIAKTSGSGERLDSAGAFTDLPGTIWSLPMVSSTVAPAGTAIVGAFATQSALYVRESVNLRVSDSDQDDFLRNITTYLAEARVAFAVYNAPAFCTVALA
jgi:hypothetical protein